MDINEMHLAVQQGVDKINSFQADTLLSEEIDLELNKSIEKFINLKYGKNNIYQKGFEESQKRIDDLRTLVVEQELLFNFHDVSPNNTFVYQSTDLPEDYRYLIKTLAAVTYERSCTPLTLSQQKGKDPIKNSKKLLCSLKFTQQDDIHSALGDPFNTTKKSKPLFIFQDNIIQVYTNDIFIIKSLKLTYIKNPAKVSLSSSSNCDLADHTHQEVVDMTISSILEGISDPRYKTQQAELSKNE
tara:strand:+ start:12780 stop:13508 length:729 start_codon:yes stop_codon:yes gene_type:complete